MSSIADGATITEIEREAARAFFRKVGTGWRAWSSDKRSIMAKMQSKQRWATRRARYGESGQRPLNYKRYREARGFPPIGDDGREQTKLPTE